MFTVKRYWGRLIHYALSICVTGLVIGCSTLTIKPCTGLSGASPALQAQSQKDVVVKNEIADEIDTRTAFHHAALNLNPSLYATEHPFYLLGIEKPRNHSETPYPLKQNKEGIPTFDIEHLALLTNQDDKDDIENVLDDPHPLVLTHILKTKRADTGAKECFIYNIYKTKENAPWCQYGSAFEQVKNNESWTTEGWNRLNYLHQEIENDIQTAQQKPTHIIMLATGWNTEEYESFLDFNAWMNQLSNDFRKQDKAFRPIFVGIAWESEWPVTAKLGLPFISVGNKGNDADTIGFTWANYLLNDVLKPISRTYPDIKLVAIGHSFGSRIVFGSHYVRDLIVRKTDDKTTPVTLIGLQAAFPTGRFITDKGLKHTYHSDYKEPATVVITSSELDKATNTISIGTGYIGGAGGLEEIQQHKDLYGSALAVFNVKNNEDNSDSLVIDAPSKNLVSVYNATPFVNCELAGTASGAHSDVYDKDMGHFLGEIIRQSFSD